MLKKIIKLNIVDKIWISNNIKNKCIIDNILSAIEKNSKILIFAHFEKSLSIIKQLLSDNKIEFDIINNSMNLKYILTPVHDNSTLNNISLSLAHYLPIFKNQQGYYLSDTPLDIILTEHHPLKEKDDQIIHYVKNISKKYNVYIHSSLEEPLFKYFGSEKIIKTMRRIQADDNEPIESELITSSLNRARIRLKRIINNVDSIHSVEEWFRSNLNQSDLTRLLKNL